MSKTNTLSFCKEYKKEFVLGPIFKMLEVFFEIITPFIMKYIVNEGISSAVNEGDYKKIILSGILLIAFAVLGFGSTIVCQYFASIATWGVGRNIRNALYKKIFNLDLETIEKIGKNELITVMSNDVINFQNGVALFIRLALRAPFIVIGSLICSFIINYKIALIFLGIIPLMLIVYFIVFKYSSKQILKVQSNNDELVQINKDTINGLNAIKSFNKEEVMKEIYNNDSTKLEKELNKNSFLNSIINPFTFLVVNIGIILIIYFSWNMTLNNVANLELTSGDLVALISYLNHILVAMIVVCNLIVVFTKAYASSKRINKILELEEQINNTNKIDEFEHLEFNHVYFGYNNENKILNDINFKINKNEKVAIIGETGSGKSTIIKLLLKLYKNYDGEIKINDVDINSLSLDNLVSYVSQNKTIFKGTIKENLLPFNRDSIDENRAIEALKNAELYDFILEKDSFLNFAVEENGKNLSGGQKQRLAIARALYSNNNILIFDDSFSALDYKTDKNIRENLNKLDGKTIILITQRITSLKDMDKIIVLDKGSIINIGTHDELIKNSSFYKEIYDTQVRNM